MTIGSLIYGGVFIFAIGLFNFGLENTTYEITVYLGTPILIIFSIPLLVPKKRKVWLKEFKNNWFYLVFSIYLSAFLVPYLTAPFILTFNAFVGEQNIKVIKGVVVKCNDTGDNDYNLDIKLNNKKKYKLIQAYSFINPKEIKVVVNEDLFKSIKLGDKINIKLRVGFLGIEYQFKSDMWNGDNVYLDKKEIKKNT